MSIPVLSFADTSIYSHYNYTFKLSIFYYSTLLSFTKSAFVPSSKRPHLKLFFISYLLFSKKLKLFSSVTSNTNKTP